ncbi:MAG: beta-ketoacyl-[acyl-carrier-protein] synthase family protein [Desulfobacterales bacterium]|nr:beta-ketoacyl-[acyl-carrier-protein] synthase family protein [Desulfobacterales bacterium]MBF0395550.1 beta-ketoacyl-[acyl-carrier-protein] synthase family protein [Desulfobacterales bacterium]
MSLKRVVITGMGAVSPYGIGVENLISNLIKGKSAVQSLQKNRDTESLKSKVVAIVQGIDPKEIPRKYRRSMSNMSIYAVIATREALQQSILSKEALNSEKVGVAISSTIGSAETIQKFFEGFVNDHNFEKMRTSLFFQIMNHTCAANVAQYFGIKGRILSPSAACATSCQALGYAYEMIAFGKQDIMICGGADEYHPIFTGTFDVMNAASTKYNDKPILTPRPFDKNRDGIVCGEGSGIIVIESLESAIARSAKIFAEVVGFATVSDTSSIANPDSYAVELCMKEALKDANISPDEIDYVNAHATATIQGDISEGQAIYRLFGENIKVSSLKGHIGHTMAASGSLEIIATICMMNKNILIPTLNLEDEDTECGNFKYIKQLEEAKIKFSLKNNFALGGINASVVLRRYDND